MNNNKFVIVISGSTGTGKTEAALQIGENIPVEIVNADIGSFYTDMTIGTAKPDWKSSTIPHHFFDVIDGCSSWTAPQFRERLTGLIQEIWQRGNIPVVVGGSAFYIKSFFYDHHDHIDVDQLIYDKLEEQEPESLWQQLHDVDPDRALVIEKTDKYRLVRALAIWQTSGHKPSEFQQIFNPLAPFLFITVQRDREQLYNKINARTLTMLEDGWIDEVKKLAADDKWQDFIQKKKMIGYDSILDFLKTDQSEEDFSQLVHVIQKRTRNYAKRQVTFLRKLKKQVEMNMKNSTKDQKISWEIIEWNLTLCDLGLYIKQLSERISQFLG